MSWDIKALGLGFRLQLYEVYRVMLLLLSGFDIELCSQAGFSWLGALTVNHENWFCKDVQEQAQFRDLSARQERVFKANKEPPETGALTVGLNVGKL